MEMTSLAIAGHLELPVPNRFFRQESGAGHLAILLPGYGLSNDTPLHYFTTSHLLDRGADVLLVDYDYSHRADYRASDAATRRRWLLDDTTAICRGALGQRPYRRITLVGKSLGTRAMAHLLSTEERLRGADAIWFTPIWTEAPVAAVLLAARRRALVIIGTADPLYDPAIARKVRQALDGELLVIADAEHGLEIAGDVIRSVHALEEAISAVARFVGRD